MIDTLFVVAILQTVTTTSIVVLATTILILGVWELMRGGLTGITETPWKLKVVSLIRVNKITK